MVVISDDYKIDKLNSASISAVPIYQSTFTLRHVASKFVKLMSHNIHRNKCGGKK